MKKHIKPLVFIAALTPAAWLLAAALTDNLGANPIEALTRSLGDWALRLLLLTLAISPLRRMTGWRQPAPAQLHRARSVLLLARDLGRYPQTPLH
jgi:DMSO/TMAO reductase YedYZ heme-binding membrane subunit